MTDRTLIEQRTLALAGVAQAARIVDLAAKTGSWPTPFVEASIHSLFCFEPDAVDAVFGTPQGIRLGLEQLSACLSLSQDESAAQTLRYTLAMLQLEKRFAKRDDLQSIVHARLKHAAYGADNFSSSINTLTSGIAAIYQDTLSTLPYRIKITGSAQHLNSPRWQTWFARCYFAACEQRSFGDSSADHGSSSCSAEATLETPPPASHEISAHPTSPTRRRAMLNCSLPSAEQML